VSEMGFTIPAGALLSDEERTGRILTCTRCLAVVRVYEATHGAQDDSEHRFLDPATFTCGECCELAADPARALRKALDEQRDEAVV
jgi:hypothetical protein